MTFRTLAALILLVGCHPRYPEAQPNCVSAAECTRNYAIAKAKYDDCKESRYGSVCAEEANEMEGAFNRMYSAQNLEQAAKAEQERKVRRAEQAREEQAKRQEEEANRKEREGIARQEEERRRERAEAAQAEVDAQAQAVREATEARQQAVLMDAQRRGFNDVVFAENGGLSGFLEGVIREGTSIHRLGRTAIELAPEDASFEARTVLTGGEALFTFGADHDPRVFFRAPKGRTIYQGTSLTSLGVNAVKVTGVRSYTTPRNTVAQAFVITPVW